ncbi:hypothetical protein ASPVEDRAFT_776393 [Aspergillus versicolor CBS 583.65]|uniref:Uncharacterized protein n=1 Tax=Aspergillus versicolor CBS 583.65 TaxID=1036611 RepID=A0A1L9PRU6_ASPVE|nr:uncharacterized protein ASPVEDRAFT_776393 [Aspergillus versicolor CBS 583.65]OJJ04223.1 hypothetical protein ASPVEDRAFT_776393 [Aspergillus versicolor CBS 583.65]
MAVLVVVGKLNLQALLLGAYYLWSLFVDFLYVFWLIVSVGWNTYAVQYLVFRLILSCTCTTST